MVRIAECRLMLPCFMRRNGKSLWGKQDCCRQGENSPSRICGRLCVGPAAHHHRAMAASVFLPIESAMRLAVGYLKNSPKHGNRYPRSRESQPPWQSVPLRQNPTRKACRPGAGRLETLRFENRSQRNAILENSGSFWMWDIPPTQKARTSAATSPVRLQSASCAADRGELKADGFPETSCS